LIVIGLSEGTTSTLGVQPPIAQTPPDMSSASTQALVAVCPVVTLPPSPCVCTDHVQLAPLQALLERLLNALHDP
jgi:hypothetical protein